MEGFGVLTEIDVKSTFKKSSTLIFMIILSGCMQPLNAYESLKADRGWPDASLQCDCLQKRQGLFVSTILPTRAGDDK